MKWGKKTDSNFSSEATSIGWCTIVLLCVTELLAEPLNFYGDILLCFEKGLLKCISATHFLKKERARIWNITIEGIKRVERREKSGMQSFFFKSLAQPSRDLFVCRRLDTAKFYPFLHPPSSSSSSFFSLFRRGKFVFRLHKIAFSYFKQPCMHWKIFHIIYP